MTVFTSACLQAVHYNPYNYRRRGISFSIQIRLRARTPEFNSRDFFSSPPCPDWLWGPTSFLSNGYRGFLPCR